MFKLEDVITDKQAGQCLRKRGYYERKYAEERAKQTSKRDGIKCRVYKCPYCALWHVTSWKHEDCKGE